MNSASVLRVFLALLLMPGLGLCGTDAGGKKSEVVVLCTLHQFHNTAAFYSFEQLSRLIEDLRPDVLAVELTPADLSSRREQKVKQEYQRSIFPLIEKRRIAAIPLEPAEPLFSQLVGSLRTAERELGEKAPGKDEAFGTYVDSLYDFLFKKWDSPLAVNSRQTDALFEVKHNFQNSLYGKLEEQGWEGWNRHFVERTLDAARARPGARIVVVVGVEHGYWLRERLGQRDDIKLLSVEDGLR